MNVLIACEESQTVTKAFRDKGYNAFSCDIVPCSGGHPEWHIQNDCLEIIKGNVKFSTMDGEMHYIDHWDLMVAHPPCTYLTFAGASHIYKDTTRIPKGFVAKEFLLMLLNNDIPYIAVENPPPMKVFGLPKYDQLVHPYQFGESRNKQICWWLKNLPPLKPTKLVDRDTDLVVWTHKKLVRGNHSQGG